MSSLAANPQEDTETDSSVEVDPPVLSELDANLCRAQSFTLRNTSSTHCLHFKVRTPKTLWHGLLATPNRGCLRPHESVAVVLELTCAEADRRTLHTPGAVATAVRAYKLMLQTVAASDTADADWAAAVVQSVLLPFAIKATSLARLLLTPMAPARLFLEPHRLCFSFTLDEDSLQFRDFGNACLLEVSNPHSTAVAVKFKTLCPTRYSIAPPFVVLPPGGARSVVIALTRATRDRLYVYEKSQLRLRDCLRVESALVPYYAAHAARDGRRCPNELATILDAAWRHVPDAAVTVDYVPCDFVFSILPLSSRGDVGRAVACPA
ncbi:hypothetical protein ACHHYP_10841 [Achlya hypogyna]|uniref:MSP domain-containing protein n=1 Tax=Achlya hypogyna TaxID=1202772 RepID=A0A1V9YKF5_ACHHY|nr:hypothetical protein ACHHYP_10841 [Achlya hypogyna]